MMNESGIGAAECLTALRLTNYNVQEAIKYVAPSSHFILLSSLWAKCASQAPVGRGLSATFFS